MTLPIEVKVDLEANASYVRYRRLLPGEHVAETVDVVDDGSVAADVDARGNILGIELLGFNGDTMITAQKFASDHDLAFPRDLSGVAFETHAPMAMRA